MQDHASQSKQKEIPQMSTMTMQSSYMCNNVNPFPFEYSLNLNVITDGSFNYNVILKDVVG